jgi:18S rRNA (guanine1575-N7)-methyltransferase
LPFKPGTFNGCISVSAIQWLCVASSSKQNVYSRIKKFFIQLYMILKPNSKAIFQFYPENAEQCDMITNAALKAGFSGGLVIDYPNSPKAKKL